MSANLSFGGFNVSLSAGQVAVGIPTQPTSKLYEILVEGQVPSNPHVFNQGITGEPTDYVIDRKGVFVAKIVFAACIFTVFIPLLIAVPLLFFAGSGFGVGTPLIIFIVFMTLAFSGLATFLLVSAVKRPRLIVFNVAQRGLFLEYGCKGPEIVDFDELGAPYIIVNNDQKQKHRLHFDLRIPRLNGESDIAIELTSLEARFKSFNGVSVQTEKLTRDMIEIAAKVCHIFRYVKQSNDPASIPLRIQFNLAELD